MMKSLAVLFALAGISGAVRVHVQEFMEQEVEDGEMLDHELMWAKGLYGSLYCEKGEREEFEKRFGFLPGPKVEVDAWAKPLEEVVWVSKGKAVVDAPTSHEDVAMVFEAGDEVEIWTSRAEWQLGVVENVDQESRAYDINIGNGYVQNAVPAFKVRERNGAETKEKRALFFYPDNDHNGAFAINDHMCYRLLSFARMYPNTKLIHVSTIAEASAILSATPEKTIQHLVVGGHGSPTSLSLGPCSTALCRLSIFTPSSEQFWNLAASRLTETGRIFLDSCLNGKSEKGSQTHAQYVASIVPGHRIYASEMSFGASNYVVTDFKTFNLGIRSDKANDEEKKSLGYTKNFVVVENCVNSPAHWEDSDGRDCATYKEKGLCLELRYSQNGTGGASAAEACCACGGGAMAGTHLGCPDFADTMADGRCVCKEKAFDCFVDGKECSNHGTFLASEASHAECRNMTGSCAKTSNAYYFSSYNHLCACERGNLCFQGNSTTPGCPGKEGNTEDSDFNPTCTDCVCKKPPHVDHEFRASCTDGLCTCPAHTHCYKGERKGACPIVPDYATEAADGPIKTSDRHFTSQCQFCMCHAKCQGAIKGKAKKGSLSDPDGGCKCGTSAKCFHKVAKSLETVAAWKVTWPEPKAIEAGHEGDCPNPRWSGYSDTDFEVFKCPDCHCAYSGPSGGAPTKKGSTCHVNWELNDFKCDRADGCCNVDDDETGPWCPVTDPEIEGGTFGDGAFNFDSCTPTGTPHCEWRPTGDAGEECDTGYSKGCGEGVLKQVFGCFSTESGESLDNKECLQYAAMPTGGSKCYDCDKCTISIEKLMSDRCADFCNEGRHCEYSSCWGCDFCGELQDNCFPASADRREWRPLGSAGACSSHRGCGEGERQQDFECRSTLSGREVPAEECASYMPKPSGRESCYDCEKCTIPIETLLMATKCNEYLCKTSDWCTSESCHGCPMCAELQDQCFPATPDTRTWTKSGPAGKCKAPYGGGCGAGMFEQNFICSSTLSGRILPDSECSLFAPKPAGGAQCWDCSRCNMGPVYSSAPSCADWCDQHKKRYSQCSTISCSGCPMCLELKELCAAQGQ